MKQSETLQVQNRRFDMITAQDTLPHVREIIDTPIGSWYVATSGSYPGMSPGPFLRPEPTPFPQKFLEVITHLTSGHFRVIRSPQDAIYPGGVFEAAHYSWLVDLVGIPVAERFATDDLVWHGLFHEVAHMYDLRELKGRGFNLNLMASYRATTEIIADTAAYAVMRMLGKPDNKEQVAHYRHHWGAYLWQPWGEQQTLRTAEISATIANRVLEVLTHV